MFSSIFFLSKLIFQSFSHKLRDCTEQKKISSNKIYSPNETATHERKKKRNTQDISSSNFSGTFVEINYAFNVHKIWVCISAIKQF